MMFLENEDRFITTNLTKNTVLWNKNENEIILTLDDDLSKSLQFDNLNFNKFVQG